MSLASLYNTPIDDESLLSFLFANYDEHAQLVTRVQLKKNISLKLLDIRSMDINSPGNWALAHQAMHGALNSILGVAGSDFTLLDPKDRDATQGLIILHANDHLQYRAALGF